MPATRESQCLAMCAWGYGMRFHVRCFLIGYALLYVAVSLRAETRFSFHVLGSDAGGWPELLSSIGLTNGSDLSAGVAVAPHGTDVPAAEWAERVERGTMLVLEGESPLASAFGFRLNGKPPVSVRSVEDLRAPDL